MACASTTSAACTACTLVNPVTRRGPWPQNASTSLMRSAAKQPATSRSPAPSTASNSVQPSSLTISARSMPSPRGRPPGGRLANAGLVQLGGHLPAVQGRGEYRDLGLLRHLHHV